ncbi:MAG: hypothetical protein HY720_12365 [Planctomycetes bacterium]|nr:hypothetical protein [Planctomycetota bacterium]
MLPERGFVETFAIDPPVLLVSGTLFSLLAVDPSDGRPFHARASFRRGTLFAAGAAAVAFSLYAVAPDWMATYLVSAPRLGWAGILFLSLFLYFAPYAAGYAAGLELRRSSRRGYALLLFFAIALLVAASAATWDETWVAGTREEYLAGKAIPLWEHRSMGMILAAGFVVLGAWAGWAIHRAVEARREHESVPGARRSIFDREEVAVVQAVAERFFPATPGVPDHAGQVALGEEFGRYAVDMPWVNRLVLCIAADLLQLLPLFYIGKPRRFTSLSTQDQDRYLARVSESRFFPMHVLFTVFKTGLSLLYYERPEVARAVRADNLCMGRNRELPESQRGPKA